MINTQPTSRNCLSRALSYVTENRYAKDLQRRVDEFRLSIQDTQGPRIYDIVFDQEMTIDGKKLFGIRVVKAFVRSEGGGLQCEYKTYDVLKENEKIDKKMTAEPSQNTEWQQLRNELKVDVPNLADTFERIHRMAMLVQSSGRLCCLSGRVGNNTYFIDFQLDRLAHLPFFAQHLLGRST